MLLLFSAGMEERDIDMEEHNKLVAALKEVIYDADPDGVVLIKRIPLICRDIWWIKQGILGLYGVLGVVLAAFAVAKIFT